MRSIWTHRIRGLSLASIPGPPSREFSSSRARPKSASFSENSSTASLTFTSGSGQTGTSGKRLSWLSSEAFGARADSRCAAGMRTRSCGWRSYTRRPSTVKTSPWSRRGRSSSSSRKSLLKEIDLARPGPCVAGGPSGTAILGVRHIEGHVVELPTSGLGAESAEQFGERRHRATDRRDHQRLFVAIAEDRRRANAFSGDEHARSRDRGPHVARCDLAPFPAMPQLNEPSDTLQDGSLLRGGRPDRQLTGSGGRLASRQRSDPRKPEVPRGPMDRRVVGRGREPEHAEPSVTRIRDAVRDERRRDPLSSPPRRDATAFEPRLGRRYHGELSHADDAPARLRYAEGPGPVGDTAVAPVWDAVLATPDRADGGQDAALIGAPRAADHQIHRWNAALEELAGLRRCHRRPAQLAKTDVADLDRATDPIRAQTPLQVRQRRDRRAIETHDQIADRETCALRGSTRDHLEDANTGHVRDPELARELPTDRRGRAADPEIGETHATIADEHSREQPRRRGREREADSLRGGDDRRVDADDFGVGVDERTPGVSRVQRGVRLDHVLDESAIPRGERSTKGAHDTGRDGRVKSERIADRDHQLTDSQGLGVGELGRWKP